MSWHAVDAVDDAVDVTRRLLFPFSLVRWVKLALLALFVGGGGAGTNASVPAVSDSSGTAPFPDGPDPVWTDPGGIEPGAGGIEPGAGGVGPGALDRIPEALGPEVIALGVLGLVLVIVAVSVASLSLRLAFYDALRSNRVRLLGPFRARLRQALGLFVFTTVLSAVVAVPPALAVLVGTAADTPTGWSTVDSLAGAIGSLPIGAIVALGLAGTGLLAAGVLALRFTYEFVVPTMIVEEVGVVGGWRRFLPVLRAEWAEILIYLVVHFVVSIGLSVVAGVATLLSLAFAVTIGGLVLLVVAALLGGLGTLVGTTVGVAAFATVTIAGIGGLLALVLPVVVVTRSYRVAYEVSTLGGIDPDLTLLHPDLGPGADGSERPAAGDTPGR